MTSRTSTALLVALTLSALVPPVSAEVKLNLKEGGSALENNLRSQLALDKQGCEISKWRIRSLFRRADEEMTPGFRALGYYSPKIEKKLTFADKCWTAEFDIDPGPRVHVRKRQITIDGEATKDATLAGVLKSLPLQEGAPLNHAQYEEIKARLRQFAAERGYLDFAFTKTQLRIYPDDAAAEIEIDANSGPRYRIGNISISDQPLNEEFVRRLIKLHPGQPYDSRVIAETNRELSDSGYYSGVEVLPNRDNAHGLDVPIELQLVPAAKNAWRFGLGYSTDSGPRGSVRYDRRYVNAEGHHFSAAASLSPLLSGLSADYTIPGQDPQRESYVFGATASHEETDTAISDSAMLSTRYLRKSEDWNQNYFIEWLHESSEIGDEKAEATLFMPGVAVDRVRADDILRTSRGYRLSFELRGAYDGLLSTTSMLQAKARVKGIYRFGSFGRLTGRVDLATTVVKDIKDLPASLRQFAGGDNSVRGYAYESLGPLDNNGDVRGGKNLLTGSIEYEHPVYGEDWWAAAFVDGGNAFDGTDVNPRYGYGVGVRWYSPVGRLRLDLAFPDDPTKDDWRIHFSLGADL